MKRFRSCALIALLAISSIASASQIKNWSAPPTWSPASGGSVPGAALAGGRSPLTVTTYPPLAFTPITPCRVADTRTGSGFPAGYGPPSMAGGAARNFTITGVCGIPAGAQAASFNFVVFNASTYGDFKIYPTGAAVSNVATLNWSPGTLALDNAAVVPLGASGQITVSNEGTGTVDIIFDVNGYYAETQAPNGGTLYNITDHIYAIWGETSATSGGYGLVGEANGGTTGVGTFGRGSQYGVYGSTTGNAIGVYGDSTGSNGVLGTTTAGGVAGVLGTNNAATTSSQGVGGFAGGAAKVFGVQGQIGSAATAGAAGVHGIGAATTPVSYGVLGENLSGTTASAGVYGVDASTALPLGTNNLKAGVYGVSKNGPGVEGISETSAGVRGESYNSAGTFQALGLLGYLGYGVYSGGNMYASGTISGTIKAFVQPHPTDATKEIDYISLEGPASEVYFRGSVDVVRGLTTIPIPDHFRLVSRSGSYSAIVSPVGAMANVAVIEQGENGIVVQASRDVKINYVVYAERETFKGHVPVTENIHFVPESEKGLLAVAPAYRQILIENGTLNPDGTTNLQTADRLGWRQAWEEKKAKDAADVAAAQARGAATRSAPQPLAHSGSVP